MAESRVEDLLLTGTEEPVKPMSRIEQILKDGGMGIPADEKGAPNGVATLDDAGKVPSSQLPSYVDDVVEFDSFDDFPPVGESGKIYVAKDTDKTYRWSGSAYILIGGGGDAGRVRLYSDGTYICSDPDYSEIMTFTEVYHLLDDPQTDVEVVYSDFNFLYPTFRQTETEAIEFSNVFKIGNRAYGMRLIMNAQDEVKYEEETLAIVKEVTKAVFDAYPDEVKNNGTLYQIKDWEPASGGSSNHYGDTDPALDLGNEGDLYSKVEYGDVAFEIVKYEDRLNYKFGRNATAARVKIENIDEYYNVYAYCGSADDWDGYNSEISIAGTDISRDSANPTYPPGIRWRWMYYDETTSELVFNQNANYGTGCIRSLIIYSHSAIKQIDSVKQKLKGNWIDIPSGGEVEVGTRMQNAKDLFIRVMDNGLIPIDSPVAQTFPKTSTDRVNVDGTFNLSNGAEGFINICKIPTYNLGMIEGSITVTSVDAGGYIAFGLIGDGVPESASDIPWVLKGQEMNTTGTYSFYVEDSMDIYEQPKPVGEYRFIVYGKSIRATVNYKEFTMDITDGEPFVRDFTVVTEDRDFIKTPITREMKISQADFDALSEEEKNNGTRYYIKNGKIPGGGSSTHTYSTEEQIVGTFIDGKPVYEKTYSFNKTGWAGIGNETSTGIIIDADIESVVETQSSILSHNGVGGGALPANQSRGSGFIDSSINAQNEIIVIQRITGTYAGSFSADVIVTVRYTKTTD